MKLTHLFIATLVLSACILQACSNSTGNDLSADDEAFLSENADRDDVTVTSTGLQYRVITEGSGPSPTSVSTVEVHYRGRLVNGNEFDSSYRRGEPAVFPLQNVIPGFREGITLMKVGATYEIVIPGPLGYGENPPQGSGIHRNATLIFEVSLLDIL